MSQWDEYKRMKHQERMRQNIKEELARDQHHRRQNHINKMMKNQNYVDQHGRQGAFTLTVAKWTFAGIVLAVLSAIGSIGEETFGQIVKNMFTATIFVSAIGVLRAFSIIRNTY